MHGEGAGRLHGEGARLPTVLPLILMSTISTVYEPPPPYGIHWAEARSEAGTVPPSTWRGLGLGLGLR